MARYLDANGLAFFWKKINEKFIRRDEFDQMKKSDSCPHCGAPFGESDYCEYCGSFVGGYKLVNGFTHDT